MKKPNIVYIMSDDHASNSISYYNSRLASVFKTPNIDSIGIQGAKMNAYYSTNSICAPARATVMTGQYGNVNGVRTLKDRWDSSTDINLAKLIKNAGYNTAFIGKWHLYGKPEGFDEYKYLNNATHNEQGSYWNPTFTEKGVEGFAKHSGYVTDVITQMTLDWLDNREDETKPFFLMCHHKAPHGMWEYAERFEHIFDGVEIPEAESMFEDKADRSEATRIFGSRISPISPYGRSLYERFRAEDYPTGKLECDDNASVEDKTRWAYQKYLKDYLRTVAGIDESVGSILEKLKCMGELDNTIVIYTSDQGMFLGEHDYYDKRWSFEESLKSPLLIRYPKEIKPGTEVNEMAANIDIAPLLLDYAGAKIPEEMQGKSFRGLLNGSEDKGRDAIYFRYWMHLGHGVPSHYGVRTKDYKLMFYYGLPLDAKGAQEEVTPSGWELYDLKKDPFEMHNVYNDPEYSNVVRKLKERLRELKIEYKDTDENYPELIERLSSTR